MAKKVTATRGQVYWRGGSWRFRVKGANGETIATGEDYTSKENAVAACEALLPDGVSVEVTPKPKA